MWAKNCKEHAKEQWRTNLLDSDTIVLKCTQIGQTDNLSFGFKHYFSKKKYPVIYCRKHKEMYVFCRLPSEKSPQVI
jgi:hypothetical protein